MTAPAARLRLFQGFGIELEYMIVARDTLAIAPLSDRLLEAVLGEIGGDYEEGEIAWSNELVLHVIELKNNGPTPTLAGVAGKFQQEVARIGAILEPMGAMLLPTGMHPTMDPFTETRLWPHDSSPIYTAYDRIFDCRGHGFANLQSTHLNLPFGDDAEFGRLHAAVRALLPLLPAIAASSPFMDGRATGLLDTRLDVYRHNQRRVPSIAGRIVPEPVFTEADYRREILERAWRDIAPLDPDGVLQSEFLNSRGAIARFERSAIEIRVLDIQEAPVADLALVWLIGEALHALVHERFAPADELRALATDPLADLFLAMLRDAEETVVTDAALLRAFGVERGPLRASELWQHIAGTVLAAPALLDAAASAPLRAVLEVLFAEGTLARRILRATGPAPTRARLHEVYRELARCLAQGRAFRA